MFFEGKAPLENKEPESASFLKLVAYALKKGSREIINPLSILLNTFEERDFKEIISDVNNYELLIIAFRALSAEPNSDKSTDFQIFMGTLNELGKNNLNSLADKLSLTPL